MTYFVSKDDLDRALAEERHHLFTAIGRALWQLEHRVSLLINVGIKERCPTKIKHKGDRKMSKVKTLIEKLWIIADKSDNKELVDITKGLDEYVKKTEDFTEELESLTKKIQGLREKIEKQEEEEEAEKEKKAD